MKRINLKTFEKYQVASMAWYMRWRSLVEKGTA
jgi:hypothetical protein